MTENKTTENKTIEKYKVTGMSCAACSARVERAVGSLAGVDECTVNLLTGDMTVIGDATRDSVVAAVISAGYGVDAARSGNEHIVRENSEIHSTGTRKILVRLGFSVGLVMILMYFSMGHMLGLPCPTWLVENPMLSGQCQMLLAGIVMMINQDFFISGFKGLIHRAPNMNTLVSIGSLASFGYSFAMLIAMSFDILGGGDGTVYLHELYFESAAMILALITVGKLLEQRAKGRTTDAIAALAGLRSKTAILLIDGTERTVSINDVKIGDIFVVRPGESIATDGEVVSGSSAIDESMLTGESMPRDISAGDLIYGGTLNTSGLITVRATKIGEGTVLAGIIATVREASATKAPIAKLADRVSAVFVPAVMALSLITFIGWMLAGRAVGYAIARAISVLVISCPCALGLATPVAIMVGSGVGARCGVLYKHASALEECGRVEIAVFDKTGTLTHGHPQVTDILARDGVGEDELMRIAASVEYGSEHPLARAVRDCYGDADIMRIAEFEAIGGKGVMALTDGVLTYGVSPAYAATLLGVDELPHDRISELSGEGKTPLVFIRNGEYIGTIAVSDTVKEDAVSSISAIKEMGIRTVMLSGDNEVAARAIADAIGIDECIAGVLPEGKEAVIRELMSEGKVAMIGDGINDAPALTRADVGIAIGRGTDIAIDSADVVLMGDSIGEVVDALKIGRRSLLNIKENLFWAFIYNCVGIPLAAGLFGLSLSPMVGAAMMSLSSFSVVMNALRLNLYKTSKKVQNLATCELLCTENDNKLPQNTEKEDEKMTVTLNVVGMMCPHCEARVKSMCEAIDGVVSAVPSHADGTVILEMTSDKTDECILAIKSAGYEII